MFKFKHSRAAVTAAAALAVLPASAMAATIIGGPGNEFLRGTNAADQIDGNAGNDRIVGRNGDDHLVGGPGNDRVFGGRGNDNISGVQGNDLLNGNAGDDTISGDANNTGDLTSFDRIYGAAGNDTLRGGDSRDHIFGGTGNDTSFGENGRDIMAGGTGDDVQDGGNGDDTFRTRDGEVDRITCGPGNDRALLDNVDVITDATAANPNGSCERVVRHAPKPADSHSEDAQQTPAAEKQTS
jgi:hypothetical protein